MTAEIDHRPACGRQVCGPILSKERFTSFTNLVKVKSRTLLILDPSTIDIKEAVDQKLAPHKQLEEPDFISGKWDYWTIFKTDQFTAANRPTNLISKIPELILSTNYITKSNKTFFDVSSIVDLEGKWHDLQDFGWTMINRDNRNEAGLELWRKHIVGIIDNAEGMLGVIVTTHI
ncbi:MAG TPA: hypothetical protein VL651_11375 [Bacteroidia bacterium]|nr:hypothetical protein [Bacteroidia bacterium]